jgi:hypothetical protein
MVAAASKVAQGYAAHSSFLSKSKRPSLVGSMRVADFAELSEQNRGFLAAISSTAKLSRSNVAILQITGMLAEKSSNHLLLDWYGGDRLTVSRAGTLGNWGQLEVGDWFEATIAMMRNGEVVLALLLDKVDEPRAFTEEELEVSYSSLPSAALKPVK